MKEIQNENIHEVLMQMYVAGKSDEEICMPDVEAELQRVKGRLHETRTTEVALPRNGRTGYGALRRVASIVLLAMVALSALALSVYVAHKVMTDGEANASLTEVDQRRILPTDTVPVTELVRFRDAELVAIMKCVSATYGKEVCFHDDEAMHLRLHFSFAPQDRLEDVVRRLNSFEQLSLDENDNVIEIKMSEICNE